jgi:hypothetical protein
LDLYKKIYGLEGEDWEDFKKGFLEGLDKCQMSKKEEYDVMFSNLDSEVQELATEVRDVVVTTIGGGLLGPILPAEFAPELWALTESVSTIDTLAEAIDDIPEPEQPEKKAGSGGYLVIFGLVLSVLIQRRRKHSPTTVQSRKEKKEGNS